MKPIKKAILCGLVLSGLFLTASHYYTNAANNDRHYSELADNYDATGVGAVLWNRQAIRDSVNSDKFADYFILSGMVTCFLIVANIKGNKK